MWPNNIVACRASENNNPTRFLHDTSVYNYYVVVSKSNNEIVFALSEPQTGMPRSYLGCIATAGRELLWVNDTEPLP